MKNLVIIFIVMLGFTFSVNAQTHYKKDGTPDMRYKENKQLYGNSYSTPSYSTPSYSTPSYSTPSYSTPSYSTPSYSTPSYSTPSYSTPSYSTPSTYPTYPNKKDGTPDMRYKENKQLYGNPYRY
jgi:hypothetical protein